MYSVSYSWLFGFYLFIGFMFLVSWVLDGILLVVDCVELEYCWIWISNPFDGFSGLEGRLGNANLSPSGVIDNNSSVVQDAKARAGDSSESDGLPKGSDWDEPEKEEWRSKIGVMLQCASGWAHVVVINGIEVDYSKSVSNSDPSFLGDLSLADRSSLSHMVIAVPGVWKLDRFGNYYFHSDLEGWEVECSRMASISKSSWFWDFDFTGALVSLAPECEAMVYVEVGIDAEGSKLYWFNDSAYIRWCVLVKGGEMDYMYIKQDIFYYDVVVDDCAWTIRETLVRTKWKTVFTESDVALMTKSYSTGFFFMDSGKVSRCDNHVSLRRVMSRSLKKAMDYEKNVVLKDLWHTGSFPPVPKLGLHYETVSSQSARLNEYRIGDGDRKLIFDFVFGPVDYGEGVQVGLVSGKMGIESRSCGLTLDIYNVALNEQSYKWLVSSRCLSTSGSSFAREVMSVCGVFFKGRDVSSLFSVPDGSMGSGVCSWQDLLSHLGGANMVSVVELEDWSVVLGDSVAYADFNKDSIVVVFSVLKSRKFGQFFVDFLSRGTNSVVWSVLMVGGVEVSYYNVVGFNLYCDDMEVSQKYRPLGSFGCYLSVHLIKRPVYKCLVGLKVAYVVGAPLFLSDFCRPLFDQWFMVCRFLGNPVWLGHFSSAVTEFLGGSFYVNEFLREVGEWTKCFVYVFGRWQEFDGKDFVFDVVLWKRGRSLVVGWDSFMELYSRFDFDAWLRSDPMLSFVLRWFFGVGGPEVKDFSYMLRYLRSGGAGSLWVGHSSAYVAEVVSWIEYLRVVWKRFIKLRYFVQSVRKFRRKLGVKMGLLVSSFGGKD